MYESEETSIDNIYPFNIFTSLISYYLILISEENANYVGTSVDILIYNKEPEVVPRIIKLPSPVKHKQLISLFYNGKSTLTYNIF